MIAPRRSQCRRCALYIALVPALCIATRAQSQVATVSVFAMHLKVTSLGHAAAPASDEETSAQLNPDFQQRQQPIDDVKTAGRTQRSALPPITAAKAPCGLDSGPAPRRLPSRTAAGRQAFWSIIARAECRFGLPSGLMDSVVLAESGYDPTVVSPAGAAGLAQLMPATASQLGVLDRLDPNASVIAGARYLRQLLDSFAGNVPLALAAYNAGPSAVRRLHGVPLNRETPGYVRRVLAYWTAPGIGPMSPLLPARQFAQMLGFSPTITN